MKTILKKLAEKIWPISILFGNGLLSFYIAKELGQSNIVFIPPIFLFIFAISVWITRKEWKNEPHRRWVMNIVSIIGIITFVVNTLEWFHFGIIELQLFLGITLSFILFVTMYWGFSVKKNQKKSLYLIPRRKNETLILDEIERILSELNTATEDLSQKLFQNKWKEIINGNTVKIQILKSSRTQMFEDEYQNKIYTILDNFRTQLIHFYHEDYYWNRSIDKKITQSFHRKLATLLQSELYKPVPLEDRLITEFTKEPFKQRVH